MKRERVVFYMVIAMCVTLAVVAMMLVTPKFHRGHVHTLSEGSHTTRLADETTHVHGMYEAPTHDLDAIMQMWKQNIKKITFLYGK